MTSTPAWLPYALGSAAFAALTAIFKKIGLEGIDSADLFIVVPHQLRMTS
jgi:uncharacterized membrane protein